MGIAKMNIIHACPLRVLAVIPGPSADSGSMVFARRQTDALAVLGVQVQRFFLATRTEPFGIVQEWRRLRKEIKAFNPDVVHCHYGTMTAFVSVFSTFRPVIVTYRGSDLNPVPSGNSLRTIFSHVLSQISAIRANRIICVSRELVERLWWGRGKTIVIPTGVDTEKFKPMPLPEARALLGWGGNDPVILFNAGSSPKVKRQDLADMSVVEAKKFLPNVKYVVLRGDVQPKDIPLYINAADVLLVTSDYEGSPTIVQEAIACGLPVVSVDVGDVNERMLKVVPSKIVPRDPVQLGAALAAILSLKQRSNGPEVAAKELSNEITVRKVIDLLNEVTVSKA